MKGKYKLSIISMLLAISGLLSGCASIVDGTNQSVSVSTPPVDGAKCELKNGKGKWYVDNTPESVVVHRAYDSLKVDCKKKGYAEAKESVESHTKGMAFGNVLVGGVVGAGVDVASGAAYDYPQMIVVPMKKTRG